MLDGIEFLSVLVLGLAVMLDRLDTARTLAEFLNVSLAAVRKWTRFALPHIKVGRCTRYDRESVLRWMQTRQQQNGHGGGEAA